MSPRVRRNQRRFAVVAGLTLAACDSSTTLKLVLPPIESGGSAIIGIQFEGQVDAHAVSSSDSSLPIYLESESARIAVALYRQDLRSLDLDPGLIPPPDGTGREVPQFSEAYVRQVVSGAASGEWEPTDTMPGTLQGLRLPLRTTCASIDEPTRPTRLETQQLRSSARLGEDEAVLLVLTDQTFNGGAVMRTDGRSVERLTLEFGDGFVPTAVASGFGGNVWIAGRSAKGATEFWYGHPDRGFELRHAGDPRGYPWRLRAAPEEGDDVLYALSSQGAIWRVDETIEVIPSERPAFAFNRVARDDIYYVPETLDGLRRLEGGAEVEQSIPNPELYVYIDENTRRQEMLHVEHSAGAGVFAGNNQGEILFLGAANTFERVTQTRLTSAVAGMQPFGDGVMIGTHHGQLMQYSRRSGSCEDLSKSVGTHFSVDELVRVPGGYIVAGAEHADADPPNNTFLDNYVSFFGVRD